MYATVLLHIEVFWFDYFRTEEELTQADQKRNLSNADWLTKSRGFLVMNINEQCRYRKHCCVASGKSYR
jgi:hypothetical protein